MFQLDRRAGRLDGRWLPAGAAQLLWDRIVREDPDLSPLLSPAGVARAAAQSWRRMHDHRIGVEALDAADTPETAAYARWCREYRRHLGQHGWVDAATAQERVHASAAAPGIELAGFDRLTPLQQALVARWATGGIEVRHAAGPQAPGTVHVLRCLDAAAELDAAARWAGALLDGRQDRRVAIVVPDLARRRGEVRRRLERVLAPVTGLAGGPEPETLALDIASARPLARQPVVAAALDLLLAHVGSPDLPTLSRLLRSPFIAGAAVEAQARARLDARLRRDARPGVRLRELSRLAEERDCPLLAGALAGAEALLSEWPEKSYPSECSSKICDLLDAVGWPGASPGSPEHQAAQRWRDLVSEFGACDEFAGRVSRGEAVGQLREMAGRVLFEPQELHSPLRVIDADTSAGMQFDALWVCGLDAGRWPPPATPDPFLPRDVQLRHGVPRASAGLATEEARRVLDRLLRSAAQVVLSVPEMEDDAPLVPSPMLAGIEPAADLPRWPGERLAAGMFRRRPRLETVVDHALPVLGDGESPRGGARLLELQSACPFRAQAELRLGARALEEPAVGVDASERGTLVHRALAILWSGLGGHAALVALGPDGTRTVVSRAVAAALAEARRSAGELMARLLDLEAEWLESRVLDMVEADRVRPPFQIEALERPIPARIGPLALELRPDRVDRLADGSLAVIDYKTGSRAEVKAWLGERPRLPQLPAYVQALGSARIGAVVFARLRSGDTGYLGLARDGEHFPGLAVPGSRGWPKACERWETLLADWRLRLERLAGEFASGSARLAPDPREACKHCQLGALCRIASTDADFEGEEAADE
jgi:probable DNA repair protein